MDARLPPLVFTLLLGCGPAIDDSPEDGAAATSSGNEPGTTTGPASASNSSSDSATPTGTTGLAPSSGSAASSGGVTSPASESSDGTGYAPPFEDAQVLGGWHCVHEGPPIFLRIDTYTSPHAVTGSACVAWNEEDAGHPSEYLPCGDLSSHPQGGDAWLSLFANAEEGGETWTLSADLVYSTADDRFDGFWSGLGSGRGAIGCTRVAPR